MIIIEGRIFIDIKIDGRPLSGANLVHKIAMLEGAPVVAPSLLMILNDHSGVLTKELCLTDANEILITVGRSPEDLKTVSRQYRVFNVRQMAGQSGPTLQVLGIYDAPKYTTEAARESFSGTSDQAIRQMASVCGLDYDGPWDFNGRSTVDNQVWMGVTRSRGSLVQHEIAKHAYMDDHSAMYACLTSLGVLRYRNVMDVIATPVDKIKYVFAFNIEPGSQELESKQIYLVNQSKEHSQAGLMNTSQNYGSTLVTDGVSGSTAVETKVDVKTGAPYLAINDAVAQTIGRAKIEYGPLDCGNTHDKYHRAEYQNKKQLGLFSERLSLIVQDPTEVQLLDAVIYKQADADPNKPVRNTDIYIVIGKTVFVADGQHYGERIDLARMSITEKGEASLKASEPTLARESSVPEVLINPTASVAADSLTRARSVIGITNPIEAVSNKAMQGASKVLNNVKLIQPSITRFGMNMRSYLEKPALAAKDIRSAAASVKQMRDTARDMRNNVRQMNQAIKSGNVMMAAAGISNVAQAAAYFRPDGIVGSFSSMLGVTQVMQTTAQIYNSISGQLQLIREPLDAIEGIGGEIDGLVGGMTSIVDDYQYVIGDMAGSYNSILSSVTGEERRLNIPNIELNRVNFESMISNSIADKTGSIQQLSYMIPTVDDVQSDLSRNLLVKDDTRNYLWAPETGYLARAVPVSALADKINALSDQIENADRQMDAYVYERSQT